MIHLLSIPLFSGSYICMVKDETAMYCHKRLTEYHVFVFVQICYKVSGFRKLWVLAQLLMGRGKAEQGREGIVVVEAGEGGRIVTVWKGKGKWEGSDRGCSRRRKEMEEDWERSVIICEDVRKWSKNRWENANEREKTAAPLGLSCKEVESDTYV